MNQKNNIFVPQSSQNQSALLFQAITVNNLSLLTQIESLLESYYGPIKQKTQVFRFDKLSQYYKKEMGETLYKCFYVFEKPVSLEKFYRYKIESQSIEKMFSLKGKRNANIDPGSLTLYQLSLLTTKAFSHRTYLSEGIYAEVTLIAKADKYCDLPWTYPDYKTPEALDYFSQAKKYLKKHLKSSIIETS